MRKGTVSSNSFLVLRSEMVSSGLTEILAQSVMPQLSLVIMSQHSHRQRVLFCFFSLPKKVHHRGLDMAKLATSLGPPKQNLSPYPSPCHNYQPTEWAYRSPKAVVGPHTLL